MLEPRGMQVKTISIHSFSYYYCLSKWFADCISGSLFGVSLEPFFFFLRGGGGRSSRKLQQSTTATEVPKSLLVKSDLLFQHENAGYCWAGPLGRLSVYKGQRWLGLSLPQSPVPCMGLQ